MHLGGKGTGVVHRRINILASSGAGAVDQGGDYGHVGVVATYVPGIAATWGNRDFPRYVFFVVTATAHLSACRHVEQVAGYEVPPGSGLAERR